MNDVARERVSDVWADNRPVRAGQTREKVDPPHGETVTVDILDVDTDGRGTVTRYKETSE